MSSLQVQTPPAAEPVSLDLVKRHLRITTSADDTLLPLYIQGARVTVESESGRSLVNKLYRQSHDRFPGLRDGASIGNGYFLEQPRYSHHHHHDERQMIKLLRSPLVNVQKIVYIGTDQMAHTLNPAPAAWIAKNEYVIGDQVTDGTNLQEVTAVSEAETDSESTSGSSTPSWNGTLAGTTTDGDLTWTNKGPAPATGDFIVDADSEPPRLFPAYGTFWPLTLRVPNAVQIFFTAGYGTDGAAAPANLKVALMEAVGVSYNQREAVTPEQLRVQPWFDRLIWSERVLDYAPTP